MSKVKLYIFQTNLSGMFKAEYIVYLCIYLHQLYLLEHDSEFSKIGSAIIRIITEGKSLIMKLGPGPVHGLPN